MPHSRQVRYEWDCEACGGRCAFQAQEDDGDDWQREFCCPNCGDEATVDGKSSGEAY